MATYIKGKDLRLEVGDGTTAKIFAALNCKFGTQRETIEISHKDVSANTKEVEVDKITHSLSVDHLITITDSDTSPVDEMWAFLVAGTQLDFKFAASTGKKSYSGKCYVTTVDMDGSDGDLAKGTLEFTVDGEVAQADIP
jgi:hypothetical protein